MAKKVLVIFNPVSGIRKIGDSKKIIKKILDKKGYQYEWFDTILAKQQPLEKFLNKHYEKIIVSGGDGTVAEVSAFLIKNKINTPLIILPQGSANILATSLFIPLNIRLALYKGLKSKGQFFDAMKINNHKYAMIAAGCGYDALVMKKTSRELKRKMGLFAYLWVILKTIFIYRSKPYKITIDKKRYLVMAKTIIIFNILPLGHLKITKPFVKKQIIPNDGLLNVYVLDPHPIRDFFKFNKRLKVFRGKKIFIKPKKKTSFQIDGDLIKTRKMQVQVLPKSINIAN